VNSSVLSLVLPHDAAGRHEKIEIFQIFGLTAGPKGNKLKFLAPIGLDESGQVNETL
jgi:hypothetical protein